MLCSFCVLLAFLPSLHHFICTCAHLLAYSLWYVISKFCIVQRDNNVNDVVALGDLNKCNHHKKKQKKKNRKKHLTKSLHVLLRKETF